jgi:hypothetical protein
MKLLTNHYFWLLVVSLPAVWFLLAPGGYEPHDFHHIADIYQMHQAIASGQMAPRLGPDFYMSYGYPLFNFYYVLPFYIGAGFYALTGSLMESFKLVFFLSAVVSVAGMYLLLKKYFSQVASFAGSVLYLYTPFRAVEIYVRGAIGEAFAIALLPWVLYVLGNLVDKSSRKNVAIAAVVIALFLLTHNYFFILASPFIVIYVLLLVNRQRERLRKFATVILSGLLAVGLSAYWWFPAFSEYKLVAAGTPFVIEDHFPFLKQLLLPSWGYGSSVWGPYDEISFQVGIVNVLVVVAATTLLLSKFVREKLKSLDTISARLSTLALICFALSIFMMNIRSLSIWHILPFTNFIQFPWRLLGITTFFTAFLAGFVIDRLRMKFILGTMLTISCVLLTANYFRPSKTLTRTNEQYLSHFFNNPQYSEDYLQRPLWVQEKPAQAAERRFIVQDGAINWVTQLTKVNWQAEVETEKGAEVTANVLSFPGWFVKVNGNFAQSTASEPFGLLEFNVPSGVSKVELYWGETDQRLYADLVSLISIGIVTLLYFSATRRRATI